jgi:hypothetical protein
VLRTAVLRCRSRCACSRWTCAIPAFAVGQPMSVAAAFLSWRCVPCAAYKQEQEQDHPTTEHRHSGMIATCGSRASQAYGCPPSNCGCPLRMHANSATPSTR